MKVLFRSPSRLPKPIFWAICLLLIPTAFTTIGAISAFLINLAYVESDPLTPIFLIVILLTPFAYMLPIYLLAQRKMSALGWLQIMDLIHVVFGTVGLVFTGILSIMAGFEYTNFPIKSFIAVIIFSFIVYTPVIAYHLVYQRRDLFDTPITKKDAFLSVAGIPWMVVSLFFFGAFVYIFLLILFPETIFYIGPPS